MRIRLHGRDRGTPEEFADAVMKRANDGYQNQKASGYPPYAIAPWDDHVRWSAYLRETLIKVLSDE